MDRTGLEKLLGGMEASKATTLYLVTGHSPRIRTSGKLIRCSGPELTNERLEALGHELLFADHRQQLSVGEEVQVLYTAQNGVRFRAVAMRQWHGLSMVFHRIPSEIPTIAELGLPPLTSCFVEFRSGLLLLTGTWGSGKSSTLAALVNHINHNSQHHIVTVEKRIELTHHSMKSMVHQREIGVHVESFAQGVRDACLHGAQVIVVSEISDYATLDACLEAAEKGFLVLSTFHATSVVSGVTKMIGLCRTEDRPRTRLRLSSVLRAMMSQHLLQTTGGNGRVPLVEILINNQAVGKAIRVGQFRDLPELMQKGRGLGMQTIDMALQSLLSKGEITEKDALDHAVDRESVLSRRKVPSNW